MAQYEAKTVFKDERIAKKALAYLKEMLNGEATFDMRKVKGTGSIEYCVIVLSANENVRFYSLGFMKGFLRGKETEPYYGI